MHDEPEDPREAPEEARTLTATELLRDHVDRLTRAQDMAELRTLVAAQTVLALEEQNLQLAIEHNRFIAEFQALVERFERALEEGRGAIARELGELVMGRPVAEQALAPFVFNLDRDPSTYDVDELAEKIREAHAKVRAES